MTAKRLLERAGEKDYYKVLGVRRDSTKKEIKKAFRKLAQKWHPDKNKENKEAATKKMGEISEAYEVLKDDEKRALFDQGVDPNAQQGAGGGGGHHDAFFRQAFRSGDNPFAGIV